MYTCVERHLCSVHTYACAGSQDTYLVHIMPTHHDHGHHHHHENSLPGRPICTICIIVILVWPAFYWNFERIALQIPSFLENKYMKYITQKDRKHTLLLVTNLNVPSSKKFGWRRVRSAGLCAGHCAARSESVYFSSDFAGCQNPQQRNVVVAEAPRLSRSDLKSHVPWVLIWVHHKMQRHNVVYCKETKRKINNDLQI